MLCPEISAEVFSLTKFFFAARLARVAAILHQADQRHRMQSVDDSTVSKVVDESLPFHPDAIRNGRHRQNVVIHQVRISQFCDRNSLIFTCLYINNKLLDY